MLTRRPRLINDIGLVIVDEFQNIGDAWRGTTIETLLTRLLISPNPPQIIGLSATIPNAADLAGWLDANLIQTTKRDVELREGILYVGQDSIEIVHNILKKDDFLYREFNTGNVLVTPNLPFGTIEGLGKATKDDQILVFTSTQRDAEYLAQQVADSLPIDTAVLDVMEELEVRVEPTPSTRNLKRVLQKGVAFHHAGLLPEERVLIENGFKAGKIRLISATTTLSAGVNTPAKNVVFRTYQTFDRRNIFTRDYKNMSGRAGRLRKDLFGRSVLIGSNEKEMQMLWEQFVNSRPEQVTSQLAKGTRLDFLILNLIASGVSDCLDQIMYFIQMTFFGYSFYEKNPEKLRPAFDASIKKEIASLEKKKLVVSKDDKIFVTDLGRKCAEELLAPNAVWMLFDSLSNSAAKIRTTTDLTQLTMGFLHLACCAVDNADGNPLLFEPKSHSEQEELDAIWELNKDRFLCEPKDRTQFLRSLRTVRMLSRWIEGVPASELNAYAPQGIIKRNAETISWVVRGLARIADDPELKFGNDLIGYLQTLAEQLFYGVPVLALSIMRLNIPLVNRNRAIQLVKAGYATIDDLTQISSGDLARIPGIGEKTALAIKERVEEYIPNQLSRARQYQLRKADELKKNNNQIVQLYDAKGEAFGQVCVEILKSMGLDAVYLGDVNRVDGIIRTPAGIIALEGKRKENEKKRVTSTESEEVLGKSGELGAIAHVTFGYPEFTDDAKKSKSKITLIKASILGDMLISFWEDSLSKDSLLRILKSGKYIESLSEYVKRD